MSIFKIIIISDIPKFSRGVEAFLLIFLNPIRLFQGIINFIKKDEPYTRLEFNCYPIKNIKKIFKNFKIEIITNLDNVKFTRYTVILKKK